MNKPAAVISIRTLLLAGGSGLFMGLTTAFTNTRDPDENALSAAFEAILAPPPASPCSTRT